MSSVRNYHQMGGTYRNNCRYFPTYQSFNDDRNFNYVRSYGNIHGDTGKSNEYVNASNFDCSNYDGAPSMKRRKYSSSAWGACRNHYVLPVMHESASMAGFNTVPLPSRYNADASTSTSCKRERSRLEDDEVVFMSREEIERLSPSRKDGIDALRETHLRYSYCAFLQNLGLRLDLPQTTIGTAMVLCHRFFVRRSHACHDRFLIATAALFLASKSEETPRPLTNVLQASCEIYHKQDVSLLSYLLPIDWFEQYRERVTEAEQLILTTLNFELNVQHPYAPLTSVLNKLGLSHTVVVNLAVKLISEGLRSSLWLQFKPHQIAAGAAFLAARFLNMDLAGYHNIWKEFQATPSILQDVSQQLMEIL